MTPWRPPLTKRITIGADFRLPPREGFYGSVPLIEVGVSPLPPPPPPPADVKHDE